MMTFSPLLAGVGSKTIEKWRDSSRNTCLHNEWGTKKKGSVCAPTCAYGLALETGAKTREKKETTPAGPGNIFWCRIKHHIASLAKKTEQYKTVGSSKENGYHLQSTMSIIHSHRRHGAVYQRQKKQKGREKEGKGNRQDDV